MILMEVLVFPSESFVTHTASLGNSPDRRVGVFTDVMADSSGHGDVAGSLESCDRRTESIPLPRRRDIVSIVTLRSFSVPRQLFSRPLRHPDLFDDGRQRC